MASFGRNLDGEGMENLSKLAESFGRTEKEGQFSFRTAKDRDEKGLAAEKGESEYA